MQKKSVLTSLAGLLLLLVILGLAVALMKGFGLRADLTEQRLYSLSQGSVELLQKLPREAEVTLKFYFSRSSEKVPMFLKSYADQVDYLLRSYAARSGGKVKVERFDPQPDSDAEEWAQRYGIEGQTVDPFAPPIYFGLAVVSGDKEEVIPVFSPRTEQTLEYDISRAIARVTWPQQPVIGVMSGALNVLGDEVNPMMMQRRPPQNPGWYAFAQLKRDNVVKKVAADVDAIPPDVTLLVVVHPKDLAEKTLYAIDQFVLRGGKLLVCVDPLSWSEAMQSQGQMMAPPSSSLTKLFDAWGIGFDPTKVVADMRAVTRINAGNGGVEESPVFLSLNKDNMNTSISLTAQLANVLMAYAGAIENRGKEGLFFRPMIETSASSSSLVDTMAAQYGVQAYRAQLEPSEQRYTVAARVNGKFETAFPDGKPKSGTEEKTDTETVVPHLATGESAVIIFGDSDFLFDPLCVQNVPILFGGMGNAKQPFNDNLALLFNSAEQLTGRNELIAIRTRANSMRPFKVVDELELQAVKQYQQKEENLQKELNETAAEIQKLQNARTDSQSLMLSKEQQEKINAFRDKQQEVSRQLKNVRRDLRQDIERLGVRMKVINILLLPLCVIVVGVVRVSLRRHR